MSGCRLSLGCLFVCSEQLACFCDPTTAFSSGGLSEGWSRKVGRVQSGKELSEWVLFLRKVFL